jgi:Cell shape-determining protein
MKNLWLILHKYNAFFLFVVFFGLAFYLIVTNNSFQRASAVNSSNRIVGGAYAKVNAWKSYLHLSDENALLAEENAALRKQLQYYAAAADSVTREMVQDTVHDVQYNYIVAKVTNNSIHQKNNYVTLDKGSKDGIKKGMGVISASGIVGIVLNVSPHFATVQSLLHSETRISAALEDSQSFGSLVWGDNYDHRMATLKDIPNHVKVRKGERVFTSGFSLFPPGIPIGKVVETGISGGDSFLDIKVELSTQFHNLQQVYVVEDLFSEEKTELESLNEDNG